MRRKVLDDRYKSVDNRNTSASAEKRAVHEAVKVASREHLR